MNIRQMTKLTCHELNDGMKLNIVNYFEGTISQIIQLQVILL